MDIKEDYIKEIAYTFGKENQEAKLIEEMGELLKELGINIRDKIITENTISEMADVRILMDQLLELYGEEKKKEHAEQIEYKLQRTIKRISEGYYK